MRIDDDSYVAAMPLSAMEYQPRDAERAVLYRVIDAHLEAFLETVSRGRLPAARLRGAGVQRFPHLWSAGARLRAPAVHQPEPCRRRAEEEEGGGVQERGLYMQR
jgi:hypothetical protein